MKRLLLLCALALGTLAAGCGSNPCETACEKQKSCAAGQAAECDKLGPTEKETCKALLDVALRVDCSQVGQYCEGELRTHAEQITSCQLDPTTCDCVK